MEPILPENVKKSKSLGSFGSYSVITAKYLVFVAGMILAYVAGMYSEKRDAFSAPITVQYPAQVDNRTVYVPSRERSALLAASRALTAQGAGDQGTNSISGLNSPGSASQAFVASKNGAKYYPVTCKSASRIKDENKVYFATTVEAESAGYTATDQCAS